MDILHKLPAPDLTLFDDGLNIEERCGAIFEDSSGECKVIEVPNRHTEPTKHFMIHTSDVKEVTADGEKLIGMTLGKIKYEYEIII